MIKVTMQKNVLVTTDTHMFKFNYIQFFAWLQRESITNFNFRPSDKGNSELIARRCKKLIKAGFEVSRSSSLHHFMRAELCAR